MKRFIAFTLILMLSLSACAEGLWLLMIDVGKADAILVGDDTSAVLVDTGEVWHRGRILTAMANRGITALDAVILTHTDGDHSGGLSWLAGEGIPVTRWIASAYSETKDKKHPLLKAADANGCEAERFAKGDSFDIGAMHFDVLAPESAASTKEDDNSLVLMLTMGDDSILLAGDMEYPEEERLLASGQNLACDVLKVANHGDDDTCGGAFVKACSPTIALISTSPEDKPGTPDPALVERLTNVGAEVLTTWDSGDGILVTFEDGVPKAESIGWDHVDADITISELDAERDCLTLINNGDEVVDLAGFYIASSRGDECLVFDSIELGTGESLTVGSLTCGQQCDVQWQDKNVIHDSKLDVLTLYSPTGDAISSMSN